MSSEPTSRDVLELLMKLDAKVDRVDAKVRDDMATKGDVTRVEAKVDAHRAETAKGFAEPDRELAGHSDPVHRDLEKRVAALEAAAPRPAPAARRPRRRT